MFAKFWTYFKSILQKFWNTFLNYFTKILERFLNYFGVKLEFFRFVAQNFKDVIFEVDVEICVLTARDT